MWHFEDSMCGIELLSLREAVATTEPVEWRPGKGPAVSRPGEMLDGETTPSSGRCRGEMQWLWWRKEARRGSVEVTSMISASKTNEEYPSCDWLKVRWTFWSCVFGTSSCNLVNCRRPFSQLHHCRLLHQRIQSSFEAPYPQQTEELVAMFRTAAARALRAATRAPALRQSPIIRQTPSFAIQSIRCYSAPASLSKDEVQGRIMDLLKNFDKAGLIFSRTLDHG